MRHIYLIMPKADSPAPQRGPKQKEITLNDVWSSLMKIQDSVLSHDNKLKSIVNNIKSLETSLKSFSLVVENLSSELAQVKEEKAALNSDVKLLQEKVSCLENASRTPISESDIFHEAHERMLKASKLIVFNLPSTADETPQTTSCLINDLFTDLSVQCKPISSKRIGRSGSRPCPIVVELSSPSDVRLVLRNRSKMRDLERWNKVWLNEDLTLIQRKQLSIIRSDLQRRREAGERDWVIRHINGSPQLTKRNFNGSTKN